MSKRSFNKKAKPLTLTQLRKQARQNLMRAVEENDLIALSNALFEMHDHEDLLGPYLERALVLAVKGKYYQAVEMLLTNGAQLNEKTAHVYQIAIEQNDKETLEALILNQDISIIQKTYIDHIEYALKIKNTEVADHLIAHVYALTHQNENHIFFNSCVSRKLLVVDFLIAQKIVNQEKCFDALASMLSMKDISQDILHIFETHFNNWSDDQLKTLYEDCVNTQCYLLIPHLLEQGLSFEKIPYTTQFIANECPTDILEKMIDMGFDVNKDRGQLLCISIFNKDNERTEMLLKKGADPYGFSGRSMIAAGMSDYSLFKQFLEKREFDLLSENAVAMAERFINASALGSFSLLCERGFNPHRLSKTFIKTVREKHEDSTLNCLNSYLDKYSQRCAKRTKIHDIERLYKAYGYDKPIDVLGGENLLISCIQSGQLEAFLEMHGSLSLDDLEVKGLYENTVFDHLNARGKVFSVLATMPDVLDIKSYIDAKLNAPIYGYDRHGLSLAKTAFQQKRLRLSQRQKSYKPLKRRR